ncbi:hypothetical protein [Paractinoplanes rishiriensis]|uniref:hypothetical protein n=1 Tax=Paractinoplanes rishiriensis TaxID=1050105 RepID=UPI001942BDA1|nr:hypothetical protein [Actinoplanes rishiriensis]
MPARRLLLMLAAVGGILFAPVAAHAEPGYPIEPPASSISNGTVPPGEPVVFSGRGFSPGEPIAINIAFGTGGASLQSAQRPSKPGFVKAAFKTVTADSSGAFSTPVTLDRSGKATLTATGTISGVVVTQQVTVVVDLPADTGGSDETLPTTGPPARHLLTPIGLGVGAILFGALLVFMAVRSRGRPARRS